MAERVQAWASWLAAESGFDTFFHSSRDTKILCAQRFVRLFAYGMTFLILVHFLAGMGFSEERIGVFMTTTLLGDTVISTLLTAITDKVGRRRVLAAGAAMMSLSGAAFCLSSNYWILVTASVIGVISPGGNEIGPFRAVEEAILAQLTQKEERSDIFAWYSLFGTAGAALGTVTSGWMVQLLQDLASWSEDSTYRAIFVVYAVIGIVKLGLVLMLSVDSEVAASQPDYQVVGMEMEDEGEAFLSDDAQDEPRRPIAAPKRTAWDRIRDYFPHISPTSRSILFRLLLLFLLDSFASGMASPSWLTYFFTTIHSLSPSSLGTLFLITNILATFSNLAALPLARRLGPLKTMVFTHLPSAIFLAMIPWPSPSGLGTWVAMAFLAMRACTQSMDQAPRQAFLAAAVLPSERTAVMGVVNAAKTLAQAGGIGTTGFLVGGGFWVLALTGAGMMKAGYDLLMLWMFVGLKDREESGRMASV